MCAMIIILAVSMIFQMNFRIDPTVWYFCLLFFLLSINQSICFHLLQINVLICYWVDMLQVNENSYSLLQKSVIVYYITLCSRILNF
jgi:hypothetical protein